MDPSYRTTPDGAGYRLVITQHPEECDCRVERTVTTPRNGWVGIQRWSAPCPETMAASNRRLVLTEAAVQHGWSIPAESWKPRRHGVITLSEIHPVDWLTIVTEATARRTEVVAQFAKVNQAWSTILKDAIDIGNRTPTELVGPAQVTRARIYQILKHIDDAPANPEVSAALAPHHTLGKDPTA